jgi:hypothetical protein
MRPQLIDLQNNWLKDSYPSNLRNFLLKIMPGDYCAANYCCHPYQFSSEKLIMKKVYKLLKGKQQGLYARLVKYMRSSRVKHFEGYGDNK